MHNVRLVGESWTGSGTKEAWGNFSARLELGPSLFQLVVTEIDVRLTSKPADVIATLAFLAGRMVQRSMFRENPQSFHLDQSANGKSFLRSDLVTAKICDLKPGALASKLIESAMLAGVDRFPDFRTVQLNAQEAMLRRAICELPDNLLSDSPESLAASIQTDVDEIIFNPNDRSELVAGAFDACGLAISYARHKLRPAKAAELALSVALYAGWLDQRKIGMR